MADTDKDAWLPMWERNDRENRAEAYYLLWSDVGLGEEHHIIGQIGEDDGQAHVRERA